MSEESCFQRARVVERNRSSEGMFRYIHSLGFASALTMTSRLEHPILMQSGRYGSSLRGTSPLLFVYAIIEVDVYADTR